MSFQGESIITPKEEDKVNNESDGTEEAVNDADKIIIAADGI